MQRAILAFAVIAMLVGPDSGARALPDRSDEPDRQYRLGLRLQQEGRTAEAIEAFRASLRHDPTRAQAYARLKEAYGRVRTADQLLAELSQRVERDSADFVSWNLLGVLYAKQGRWSDAISAVERAVQHEPRDLDAWTNLGWLSTELKLVEKARDAFGRALALDPGYGRAHAGVAGLYAEQGSFDKAIQEYQLALSADPDHPAYLYDMGWAYYRKGMTDRALEILTRASALSADDPTGLAKIGWARLRRKEYRAAIEEFRHALRLEPTYTFARFGLARALQAEGRGDLALAEYQRAWRESKNDVYLVYLLGIYLQRGIWIIVSGVGLGMALTLIWLLRRRPLPQGSEAATGE